MADGADLAVVDIDDDGQTPPDEKPSTGVVPEVKAKPVSQAEFAPTLTVVAPDGKDFEVSANARAHRARTQLMASRLMNMVESKIAELEELSKEMGGGIPMKTLKELTQLAKEVQSIGTNAYENKKIGPMKGNEFEQFAFGLVKAATSGAAKAGFDAKMQRIKALGKSKTAPKRVTPEPAVDV